MGEGGGGDLLHMTKAEKKSDTFSEPEEKCYTGKNVMDAQVPRKILRPLESSMVRSHLT